METYVGSLKKSNIAIETLNTFATPIYDVFRGVVDPVFAIPTAIRKHRNKKGNRQTYIVALEATTVSCGLISLLSLGFCYYGAYYGIHKLSHSLTGDNSLVWLTGGSILAGNIISGIYESYRVARKKSSSPEPIKNLEHLVVEK